MSTGATTDSDRCMIGADEGGEAMHWLHAINAYTQWMMAAGCSPHTITLRRGHLRRLAEAHLRRSPWRVKTPDLERWLGGQVWAAETRRAHRATLRSFYLWAQRSGRIRRNPAADLPTVRAPKATPRPTPDDVLQAALAKATDRDRLMIYLAAYGGLRRAEIAALRWDAIGEGTIRVHGKGDKTRVVPLHPALHRELTAERLRRSCSSVGTGYRYRAGLAGPYLFPGRDHGHISGDAVARSLRRLLAGWSVHTLRHRFGTEVYRVTGDILQVAELLGHSKPETSAGYARIPDTALRDAVNAI